MAYAAAQALARSCGCVNRSSWCRIHWREAARVLAALDHYGFLAVREPAEQPNPIKHALGCMCGINDAGQRFTDLICREA
jgi:hypothetical protein